MKELGLRWRPLGYGALLVAGATGATLAARDWDDGRSPFQTVLWVKVGARRLPDRRLVPAQLRLGPRLQAEIREGRPQQTTRPTLVAVGWTSYGLTVTCRSSARSWQTRLVDASWRSRAAPPASPRVTSGPARDAPDVPGPRCGSQSRRPRRHRDTHRVTDVGSSRPGPSRPSSRCCRRGGAARPRRASSSPSRASRSPATASGLVPLTAVV